MKLTGTIKSSMGAVLAAVCGVNAQTGWTSLNPSSDSRVIYVSSSTGNDANNGLSASTPKRTIAAGYALVRSGYPDQLLLKKGDEFYETIDWQKSGRSANEMAVMGSYGSGPRPMMMTGSAPAIESFGNPGISNVAFVGIGMKSHTWTGQLPPGQDPSGMTIISPGDNLLIEDCYIEGYGNSMIVQGYPAVRTNTKIRRNVLVDPIRLDANNGSTNIFMAQYDGVLLEENVFDNSVANETQRGAMLSHCIYIGEGNTSNNVIRGNIAHNGGRTNFNCRSGGLIENNLSIRGAQGITCGINYAPTYVTATIRANVVIDNRDNQNGQGLGFGMTFDKMQSLDIDGNLICNGTRGQDGRAMVLTNTIRSGQVRNNVIYNWSPLNQPSWGFDTLKINGTPEGPISVTGNQFQQAGNAHMVTFDTTGTPPVGIVTLAGNRYFSGRTGQMWFVKRQGEEATLPQWVTTTGESGSQVVQMGYPAPNRTIASYNSSIGGPASTDAFMTEARRQSKDFWRPQYTAAAVNNYMRAGFAMGQTANCRPDMNGDGQLNVSDFTAFLQQYSAQNTAADYNQDGLFNVADFSAYLQGYASGCN